MRLLRALAAIPVASLLAVLAPEPGSAAIRPVSPDAGVHRYNTDVCGRSWVSVHIPRTSYFSIYNDDSPANVTCIKPMQHRLDFQVMTVNPRADNWDAYPNISSGWEWGRYSCAGHSGECYRYPVREDRDGMPRTSLAAWLAPGRYNLSYDIWFNRTDRTPEGQDDGAEVMVWLAHPGIGVWNVTRRVTLDGIRWDVMDWIAHHNGTSWHYVAFVAERQRRSVTGLWLNPFFRNAIRYGELSPSWWLTGIDAGFELVQGGVHDNIHYYTLTGLPSTAGGR